jgi:UDP-N-acetylmuramyl pentapeptide synthase
MRAPRHRGAVLDRRPAAERHAAAAFGPGGAPLCADRRALLAALPQGPAAASVLVKGSRFMRMERVVRRTDRRGRVPHAA